MQNLNNSIQSTVSSVEQDWWADFLLGVIIGHLVQGEYALVSERET